MQAGFCRLCVLEKSGDGALEAHRIVVNDVILRQNDFDIMPGLLAGSAQSCDHICHATDLQTTQQRIMHIYLDT